MKNKNINLQSGAAMMTVVAMTMAIGMLISYGVTSPVVREAKIVNNLSQSKKSFYTAESAEEDIRYRALTGRNYDDVETFDLNNAVATSTVFSNQDTGRLEITTVGDLDSLFRKKFTELASAKEHRFAYAIQADEGGVEIQSWAYVSGDIFSNGEVDGVFNFISGNVTAAGDGGTSRDLTVFGDVFAENIRNSIIFDDAFYQTIWGTIVFGDRFSGSENQPEKDLPITDDTLDAWQTIAENGGVNTSCIIESSTTLGPQKFDCNTLEIGEDVAITLEGVVWVDGDISIDEDSQIRINSELESNSVAIIANDTSNPSGGGIIEVEEDVRFYGSGSGNSVLFLVSRNTDASLGGNTEAIEIEDDTEGDVFLYAKDGRVLIKDDVDVVGIAAYEVELDNGAEVRYDDVLLNQIFQEDKETASLDIFDWREIE